jgi:hypothetical protein
MGCKTEGEKFPKRRQRRQNDTRRIHAKIGKRRMENQREDNGTQAQKEA